MRLGGVVAPIAVGLSLASCATPSGKDRAGLAAVLEDYRKESERLAHGAEERRRHGIRAWSVVPSATGGFSVSLDLVGAYRATVVERLLRETALPYVVDGPAPTGSVTARIENMPAELALGVLLEGQGLTVRSEDGMLHIEEAPVPSPSPPLAGGSASSPHTIRDLALSYLDAADAADLLNGLYPTSLATGTRDVQFAVQPSTNSVVLSGPADRVAAAAAALTRADRAPRHVVIEALVIEFDANALEQVGLDLSGGAKGNFGGVATGFGSLLSRALRFDFASTARNSLAFTALLDALVANDKARLISRPYLAALSGKAASIQITRDRYVIVQSGQNGATVTTPSAVQSGVTLTITPTISESGVIRMEIAVEDSQFIPTVENIAVEVDRNQASTTMLVESGQSISIGGLFLNRDTSSYSGIPVLRDLPGLNLLFGKRKKERQNQEVVIYITPHIWQPGLDAPLTFDERLDREAPK